MSNETCVLQYSLSVKLVWKCTTRCHNNNNNNNNNVYLIKHPY